jgi:hypothetical protein
LYDIDCDHHREGRLGSDRQRAAGRFSLRRYDERIATAPATWIASMGEQA